MRQRLFPLLLCACAAPAEVLNPGGFEAFFSGAGEPAETGIISITGVDFPGVIHAPRDPSITFTSALLEARAGEAALRRVVDSLLSGPLIEALSGPAPLDPWE